MLQKDFKSLIDNSNDSDPYSENAEEKAFKYEVLRYDEPGGYENSGLILFKREKEYAIGSFSHCSCYGTWGSVGCVWVGNRSELKNLVKNRWDFNFIGTKKISPDDWDYSRTNAFFDKVAEYLTKKEIKNAL